MNNSRITCSVKQTLSTITLSQWKVVGVFQTGTKPFEYRGTSYSTFNDVYQVPWNCAYVLAPLFSNLFFKFILQILLSNSSSIPLSQPFLKFILQIHSSSHFIKLLTFNLFSKSACNFRFYFLQNHS